MAQTATTEELMAQIAQNSADWHQADETEQEALHSQNTALYAILDGQEGTASTFDSTTGQWTTSSGASSSSSSATDYSSYINSLYTAQQEATLAALEQAYQQEQAALTQEAEELSDQYQQARNTSAGVSQLSSKNFNEYATAMGLNSGTAEQAALAQTATLQAQLSDLTAEENEAYQAIQAQKTALTQEYQTAVAAATASGQTALAQALTQELTKLTA